MKKIKPTKEALLQYIYDKSIDAACKLWNLKEDEINKILYPVIDSNPQIRRIKANQVTINAEIAAIIDKNYSKLWNKYVKDKSKLNMSQTSEDIFHNTLLKVMEELSAIDEEQVINYIDYRLNMISFETKQHQKELYKHQIYLEDANYKQNSKEKNRNK